MKENIDALEYRHPEHDIPIEFLQRWSSIAMSGEEITREELMPLFEAARWAPSSYNNQPWRFFYALRGSDDWDKFLGLLAEGNRGWAKNASALIVIASKTTFDYNNKPSITHSYDTGAAWGYLALMASMSGLVARGMQGFDYDRAREVVRLSEEFKVEAMAAVGKPGSPDSLPEEMRERDAPSGRKSLTETVFEGGFK